MQQTTTRVLATARQVLAVAVPADTTTVTAPTRGADRMSGLRRVDDPDRAAAHVVGRVG